MCDSLRRGLVVVLAFCGATQVCAARKIYWTDDNGQVTRADASGTNVEVLVSVGASHWLHDIALDVANGTMYWTDYTSGKIQKADMSGANVVDVITGLVNPRGIAYDSQAHKLYWSTEESASQASDGKIQRANEDGSNVENLVTGLRYAYGIAVSRSLDKVYWTSGFPDKIQRANLDGTNVEDVVTAVDSPYSIDIDRTGGKIYWTDVIADTVNRADPDGSNAEVLVSSNEGYGIALDWTNSKLYWAYYGQAEIRQSNVDGSSVELVVVTDNHPIGLALDLPVIPAVSEWGVAALTLLILSAGTVALHRRHWILR